MKFEDLPPEVQESAIDHVKESVLGFVSKHKPFIAIAAHLAQANGHQPHTLDEWMSAVSDMNFGEAFGMYMLVVAATSDIQYVRMPKDATMEQVKEAMAAMSKEKPEGPLN